MLINFVGTYSRTRAFTRDQSKNLLQFCRSVGATLFTVNFIFAKHESSEKLMEEFYAAAVSVFLRRKGFRKPLRQGTTIGTLLSREVFLGSRPS
jgi:hypothetical protein